MQSRNRNTYADEKMQQRWNDRSLQFNADKRTLLPVSLANNSRDFLQGMVPRPFQMTDEESILLGIASSRSSVPTVRQVNYNAPAINPVKVKQIICPDLIVYNRYMPT